MFGFIRIQYMLGNLTADEVREYVPRWVTVEEAEEILLETTRKNLV